MGSMLDAVIEWLAERIVSMLGGLVSFLTATFFMSPDVTVLPQAQSLADRSLIVVNTVYVLVVIVAGTVGMTHGTLQIRYEVKDLIPRMVFGFVMANFGTALCRLTIEVANALTGAMVAEPASGPDVVRFVSARIVSAASSPPAALLCVVIGLIIVALFYLLLVSWVVRVATLIVLAGIAPVALACYGLPQLQGAAQLWWRALLGCLGVPLLQALCFTTGANLLLDPQHNVPILLGLGTGVRTDVINLLVAASLLWLTVRIPKLMGRFVTRSGNTMSPLSVVMRAVAIQSVTRRLGR